MLIGLILLSMTLLHFILQARKKKKSQEQNHTDEKSSSETPKGSIGLGILFGSIGGVATMLANAAGPIAQLYLLVMGFPSTPLLVPLPGFLIVNICKIHFMIDLGIIAGINSC